MAMEEASVGNSAASLRSLFAVILTWCEPSNPLEIYEHHKETMAEDFLHQYRTKLGNADLDYSDDIFNLALNDLQDKVLSMGVGNCQSMACHSLSQLILIGLQGYTIEKLIMTRVSSAHM